MKKLLFACSLAVFSAAPAFCNQGCVDESTTTVTTIVCTKFDCVQSANGGCITWACSKTQTNRYTDANSTGCSRVANCGKKAVFEAGPPFEDPDADTNEECDWYPCVQADPASQICYSYMCVSKRIFQTKHTTYPAARCIPISSHGFLLPPAAKKAGPQEKPQFVPLPAPSAP